MKLIKYFYLSSHFLRLSYESAFEIVNSGNPAYVTSNTPISNLQFNQMIRWTDHSVGIAALFCFYHGVELMMKGFILEQEPKAKGHKLTQLLKTFEKHYPNTPLFIELNANINITDVNSPLQTFLTHNNIQIDGWYEALKYPDMNDGKNIDHFPLKYKGVTGTHYWSEIAKASANIHKHGNVLLSSMMPDSYRKSDLGTLYTIE